MWQKIEELARLNPQVRFFCHCLELRGPSEAGGGFVGGGIEANRFTDSEVALPLVHASFPLSIPCSELHPRYPLCTRWRQRPPQQRTSSF